MYVCMCVYVYALCYCLYMYIRSFGYINFDYIENHILICDNEYYFVAK